MYASLNIAANLSLLCECSSGQLRIKFEDQLFVEPQFDRSVTDSRLLL